MPMGIYRDRVVGLSLIAVFCTGFGMFGGIVFIPLFFQGVLGASATSSGSFLTPMMLGMVFGATISGQTLSRLGGHYRTQGLIGLGIMTTGMFLLSGMTEMTSFGQAVVYLVITGFGIGTTFPTFTIAVQNAVPYSQLGVVTAANQFYRSIGGALGLAILGSIMARRFADGLDAKISPDLRESVPAETLAGMSNNPQALVNPDALEKLRESVSPEIADQLLEILRSSLATAIGDLFLIAMAMALVALVVTAFLKEKPIRDS
jgi:MFS family permease